MKPALWLVHVEGKYPNTIYDDSGDYEAGGLYKTTRLYTAHEIAEFVVTLSHDIVGKPATTEQLVIEETYLAIADRIEKESQK